MSRVPTVVLVLLALTWGAAWPADAGTAPTLSLTGPERTPYGSSATLQARLVGPDGTPLAGRPVALSRQDGDTWTEAAEATTDGNGSATFTVAVPPGSSPRTFRASATEGGSAVVSGPWTVTGVAAGTVLTLGLPHSVVDEQAVTLTLRWRSDGGAAVPGTVRVLSRTPGGRWHTYAVRHLGTNGTDQLRIRPRRDTEWRAIGTAGSWWAAAASPVHALDNRPPGRPVAYPAGAPRPAPLPAQRPAVGSGPHARITAIPDGVWRSMVGRSWHPGCPVGRAGLRLVQVNYWDFAGYRRRGEMVVRATIAPRVAAALADMYRGRFPIRAMYRVDRFGWSSRSHGGNDFAAMRHDDTDAFNCRWVTGSPGRTSPHSYGTAIDLNTWENPYWSAVGPLPDRWWTGRSDSRVAWRSASHPVVRIWRRHGFHWTYGTGDSQHMDARRTTAGGPRALEGGFVAD